MLMTRKRRQLLLDLLHAERAALQVAAQWIRLQPVEVVGI